VAKEQSKRLSLEDFARDEVSRLNDEIAALEKEMEPHTRERDRIFEEIFQLRGEAESHVAEIKRLEAERLIPLRQDLSRAAAAANGRRLSDNPAT